MCCHTISRLLAMSERTDEMREMRDRYRQSTLHLYPLHRLQPVTTTPGLSPRPPTLAQREPRDAANITRAAGSMAP